MLDRILEPEVMDSAAEATAYDTMDHAAVNVQFVDDLVASGYPLQGPILDVGTGTARIPIVLCQQLPAVEVVAIDLSEQMLRLADRNIEAAGLIAQIKTEKIDAKKLPFQNTSFAAVISNSIAHHIPQPERAMAEAVRVTCGGGYLFWRDLIRPEGDQQVDCLVDRYVGRENSHQQALFADSLRAALTLEEVRDIVEGLGFDRLSVCMTSDRHWTWSAEKKVETKMVSG